jgi:alpha-mannosidase
MDMKKLSPFLKVFLLFLLVSTEAVAQKRLYIANDDHTDYMWSGNEAQYDSAFVKTLDFHLRKIDSTKYFPDDFQNRYNCDGNYWLRIYQRHRTPAQFNQLIAAMKSGHISSPINSVVSTFGAQPTEAVLRGMYYAGHIERQYGIKFTIASAMENNTLPLGLSSLWAGSGAKYSWKGIGGYGSQLSYESRANRKYQLYNYKGLDHSSLLMKWYNYNEKTTYGFGGYAECRLNMKPTNITLDLGSIIDKLDLFCDTSSKDSKYPYKIGGAFGYGHDDLQTLIADPFIDAAKNNSNSKRLVRVSNQEDFFKDVEKTYPSLPSQSVSFGNEWDLLCASMNETTAEVRRATEKLRIAEALASIVAIKNPNFADDLIKKKDLAWDGFGLYWEHNWTGDGPVNNKTRGQWQEKIKDNIVDYVDTLYNLGLTTLGSQLKTTSNPRFFVFNPLGWEVTQVADIPFHSETPVKIIDLTTKQEIESQIIKNKGKSLIRIRAKDVPSVGYKVYEILSAPQKEISKTGSWDGKNLITNNYNLQLTPSGVITSIYDIKNKRELVKNIDGKFLNDIGVSDLEDGNPIEIRNNGSVSVTLTATSNHPIKHTVNVTLYANSPTIEIENSIVENFKDNKNWTFSFNLDKPTTHHEEQGAVLTVKKESNGGHYSDEIARYDWQTFNHFVDLSTNDFGITLSNLDCSFFKLGGSTKDSLWDSSSQINALAGGRIDKKVEDGGVLGIHDQLGQNKFNYHFAIYPHQKGFNPTQAFKNSLQHQNPLTCGWITGKSNIQQSKSFSFLRNDNPNVLLWSFKPAEEGVKDGWIARFWNTSNQPEKAEIGLASNIKSAYKTSHIETNESSISSKNGEVQLDFNKNQINTYRLKTKK